MFPCLWEHHAVVKKNEDIKKLGWEEPQNFWSIECHVWPWSQSSFNPELVPAKPAWFINITQKSELLGTRSRRPLHPSVLYPGQFGVVLTTCTTRPGHAVLLGSLGSAGSCFSARARTRSSRAPWAPIPQPPPPCTAVFVARLSESCNKRELMVLPN